MHSDVELLDSGSGPADEAQVEPPPPGALARVGAEWRSRARRVWEPVAARLGIGELESIALRTWLLSRISVGVILWATVWIEEPPHSTHPASIRTAFARWDWLRYAQIAAHGYSLGKLHGASIAFFPGYPAMLWIAHFLLGTTVLSGLLISFAAGAVACCALARIIAQYADPALGTPAREAVRNGLVFFVCGPAAVFLTVGYTESVFLAVALPAWLAARRGRWLLAGVLLAAGTSIRINGVFVAAGVAVLFLQSRPGRDLRAWARGGACVGLGLAPVALFFVYLHHLTGRWDAWQRAEADGWDRHFTWPWNTAADTWYRAFGHRLPAATAFEYQLELGMMAVGVGAVAWCAYKHRWAELVYMALSVEALSTSGYFLSVPREGLLWWPLWAGLGVWCVRRPWFKTAYLSVCAPLMGVIAYLFFTGHWAG